MCWGRIQPFVSHLRQLDYDVEISKDVGEGTSDDIWFIDFVYPSAEEIKSFFTLNEERILNFKGKVCLYSLDDGGYTNSSLLNDKIIQRIDGWLTGVLHYEGTPWISEEVYGKIILFPWFVIPHREYVATPKENKMLFYGHPTGGQHIYSKEVANPRIEAVRRLRGNETLSKDFIGGIVVHEVFNQPIYENLEGLTSPYLSPEQLHAAYNKCRISLCLPGNARWSYRHLESMAEKCAVISFDLKPKDGSRWLYLDKFEDEFLYLKDDLTNLEELCEYALTHTKEVDQLAYRGHNIYKNFFELNADKTFNLAIWFELKEEFAKRGIHFNPANEYKTVVNTFGDWWGEPADENRGGWWGWGHDEFYKELIEKEGIKTICEIGTYMGRSTHFLAKMIPPDGKVVTIDTFKGSPEHYAKNLYKQLNNLYFTAVRNLRLGEYGDKIRIINRKSSDAEVPQGYFDLVYVDGPHNVQAVIDDIVKFKSAVRPGGIISGDDYLWPQVKEGVDYCVEKGIIPPLLGVYRETIWWTKI